MASKNGWSVEQSHNRGGGAGGGRGGGRDRGGSDLKCYECGEPSHFACECRSRGGSGRMCSRSHSPRYMRSPSYGRRSYSPGGRSPRRHSHSPRGRSYSRSPGYRGCEEVPYANGSFISMMGEFGSLGSKIFFIVLLSRVFFFFGWKI
ncbi:PREDICTED: serine/arginine-rich splicing factor RSZ22A [Tarenaya hassleriana]|uniref:serine/arginine-rich splicing factor RSZ22A n=1 Tax=Tarenaya hassleriana TaxID=28532 RepID=UPI00053C549B|nr:PREDICTED: serine/arginine-rich splicing factor RSZ22A [Tarenaya hassleriana]